MTMARNNSPPECKDTLSFGKQVVVGKFPKVIFVEVIQSSHSKLLAPQFHLVHSWNGNLTEQWAGLFKYIWWPKHVLVVFICLHSMQLQAWSNISDLFLPFQVQFIYMKKKKKKSCKRLLRLEKIASWASLPSLIFVYILCTGIVSI